MKKLIKKAKSGVALLTMSAVSSLSFVMGQVPTVGGAGFGNQDTQYNPDVVGSDALAEQSLMTVIKNAINWVLGILGLIALIVLLWGGFQMVTAAGDEEKYNAGFKILKQSGIGLAFIALSWLFVSLVFWLIATVAGS